MPKLPVVAAIPHYNMGESLNTLLPELLERDYAAIYVLDDNSTDVTRDVIAQFKGDIEFVAGETNIGAGGNRNRIIPVLGREALIHFIDADMHIETPDPVEVIKASFSAADIAFVGGLIKDPSGHPIAFNYGPRQCLRTDLTAYLQFARELGAIQNRALAEKLFKPFGTLLEEWPNPFSEPRLKPVFWVTEPNTAFHSEVFKKVGGYDPNLREHEIQDLAIRLAKLGLKGVFNPALVAQHKAINVRFYNRLLARSKAEWQIAQKHGYRNWLLPDGHFKPQPVSKTQ